MKHIGIGLVLMAGLNSGATAQTIANYGTWTSPLSAEIVAAQGGSVGEIAVDHDGSIYWTEYRPSEKGRNAIVMQNPDGAPGAVEKTVLPTPYDARTRVHEYGGGNFVVRNGEVIFSNFADQRLYRFKVGQQPTAITKPNTDTHHGADRFADCDIDQVRDRVICVREDHSKDGDPQNTIVAISLKTGEIKQTLFAGSDFVAAPRIAPSGKKIAWVAWDHPNMPWDKTRLYVADVTRGGGLTKQTVIADNAAIGEPQWGPDGTLYYMSDATGWWNLYAFGGKTSRAVTTVQVDLSAPLWNLNLSSYAIVNNDTAIAAGIDNGRGGLWQIDLKSGNSHKIDLPFAAVRQLRRLDDRHVVFNASEDADVSKIVRYDIVTGIVTVVAKQPDLPLQKEYISVARAVSYPTSGDDVAHAYYYAPQNPGFRAPDGTKPPLIVMAHGGPTSHVSPALALDIQYWTTRGFAVMNVNYRGSSGFGRAYRNKLQGQWGVIDIDDVVNAAKYAVSAGLADPDALIVRGGSAGGFVVLAAHAFHNVFATGANYYGVSDITALAKETHKFESRYLDGLVAPYPEGAKIYADRSPINHLDGLNRPLIVLQGLDDEVVPPSQSEAVVNALKSKGIPVEYVEFEGEGHGFRKLENKTKALEAELHFYQRTLKLQP